MLIHEKSDEKRNTKQNSDGRQIGKNGAHFTNQIAEKKCYFCDETDDHIATAGPRRAEIIQYFAWKKFVEMTPKERFQELRRKGYCFQCLSPGASQSTGKQWWEMSERIHLQKCITWQISNQKACSGMSWAQRNYRKWAACIMNRCIMKQTKLAAFWRDLKLTFHTNQQQASDYKHLQSNQESAIYILQTIKVNKQNYSLFYDTGCCDMVSRYAAIGSRAKQESTGSRAKQE